MEAVAAEKRLAEKDTLRRCIKCNEMKPRALFKWAERGVRRQNVCKACDSARSKERYAADPERHVAASRAWQAANPARFAAVQRAYREAHKDEIRERAAAHYASHKDQYAERGRKWREANPDYRAGVKRDCSPEANQAKMSRRRLRAESGMDATDVTLSVAYRKAIKDDPCFYCGLRASTMHTDHVLPLAKGGTDHWWNLARACSTCNLRKSDKTADQFLNELAGWTEPAEEVSWRP